MKKIVFFGFVFALLALPSYAAAATNVYSGDFMIEPSSIKGDSKLGLFQVILFHGKVVTRGSTLTCTTSGVHYNCSKKGANYVWTQQFHVKNAGVNCVSTSTFTIGAASTATVRGTYKYKEICGSNRLQATYTATLQHS